MTRFPELAEHRRVELLTPPCGRVRMALDTDTYNEIDDQFALTYALLSPERITLEAVYAAPFHNERSSGPEDGMLKSYDEIVRVLDRLGRTQEVPVYEGSTAWLTDLADPPRSPAVDDLIERAMPDREGPLYVVAIGAITDVASALLRAPEILTKIVVVWLGGNVSYWHRASEFNMYQDMPASRLMFDSGVPLVHIPCRNVTDRLLTTEAEIERFVKGRGAIGDYLFEIYSAVYADHFGRSRSLWDVGPIAWLVNPAWVNSVLIPSPLLTDGHTWSHDPYRHLIREARYVQRDEIFGDLFRKLQDAS